jgi:hypothetical protein
MDTQQTDDAAPTGGLGSYDDQDQDRAAQESFVTLLARVRVAVG